MFSLEGSNGKKVSLTDHPGKVVIMEFGYTHCEYVCPITLARLTEVYKKLGDSARDVQLIYVTVDPKRDNPERLREYLSAFNPTFIGATGNPDDLAAVQRRVGRQDERAQAAAHALGLDEGVVQHQHAQLPQVGRTCQRRRPLRPEQVAITMGRVDGQVPQVGKVRRAGQRGGPLVPKPVEAEVQLFFWRIHVLLEKFLPDFRPRAIEHIGHSIRDDLTRRNLRGESVDWVQRARAFSPREAVAVTPGLLIIPVPQSADRL